MKWKKFTLQTTTEAVDYISSLFDEIGIQGIEIEEINNNHLTSFCVLTYNMNTITLHERKIKIK